MVSDKNNPFLKIRNKHDLRQKKQRLFLFILAIQNPLNAL